MHTLRSSRRALRAARSSERRRGVIILLTAFLLTFLIGMIAFAVDLGMIANTRAELQNAADAAAYAGAGGLINGTSSATTEAQNFYTLNRAGGSQLANASLGLTFGMWDSTTRAFTAGGTQPNAVKVVSNISNSPLFFGAVFNRTNYNMTATAVATYMPRDIALVLDYSRSMCFDSSFDNIGLLSQSTIQTNMKQIWVDLGSPNYGTTMTFTGTINNGGNSTVKSAFNMKNSNYPFPSGSWDSYIDYVQTDSTVNSAGHRNRFGLLTFIQYIQTWQAQANQSPGLHVASQQPLTSIKDAVDVFLSYLTAHSTDDRVSLTIYSASDYTSVLEQSLTKTYTNVSSKVRARQAGHYTGGTNISAGMNKGRLDLVNNARVGAKKMMILMTDGEATLPSGNSTSDKNACITEANSAAAAGIPIITITVGADADTALMQQIADITGGAYFQIPGGQSTAAVKSQLEAVFAQVAADRPLKLVQ
jgi:Flp pilus assembly protein TadG